MKIAAKEIICSNTRLIYFFSNVTARRPRRASHLYIFATDAYMIPVNKMILKFESDQTISHALYQKGKSLRTSQMNSLSHVEAMW